MRLLGNVQLPPDFGRLHRAALNASVGMLIIDGAVATRLDPLLPFGDTDASTSAPPQLTVDFLATTRRRENS